MCGLVAVMCLSAGLRDTDMAVLRRVNQHMALRGPDDTGEWCSEDQHVAMGHRRLAIIELSAAGHQPMRDVTRRYTIVFNGEIYNHAALRQELAAFGHLFQTRSDTEVIMAAYAQWGVNALPRLRGMFAFVIWDSVARTLFAARDSFGIKPLYMRVHGDRVWLASSCKALVAVSPALTECPVGKAGYLLWGSVPEPWTPFKEIRALPAGHYLTLNPGQALASPTQWVNQSAEIGKAAIAAQPLLGTGQAQAVLGQALRDSVAAHLVADVPVGVFLSAGLDSCTLAALAAELVPPQNIKTITLGFKDYLGTAMDEVPLAELVAKQLGTDQTTVWLSRDDFETGAARYIDATDMPTQDGVNTYFVSLAGKRAGLKVVLSGLGGDELFGSYPSFRQVPLWAGLPAFVQSAGKSLRMALSPFASFNHKPKQISALEYSGSFARAYLLRRSLFLPWELPKHMPAADVEIALNELATLDRLQDTVAGVADPLAKVSALEATWYMRHQLLRDADWASMAHSLELRLPFVDTQLWQAVIPLRSGTPRVRKTDVARTPKAPLPAAILNRPKTGFTVPVSEWFRQTTVASNAGLTGHGLRDWALHVYDRWLASAKNV